MERMEREIPKHCNDLDRIGTLENENYRLEEENKKLNEEIQRFKDNAMQDMREITELEIENRKLKEEISSLRIELVQEKGKTGKKWTPATPYI